jgi:hypothetical protein
MGVSEDKQFRINTNFALNEVSEDQRTKDIIRLWLKTSWMIDGLLNNESAKSTRLITDKIVQDHIKKKITLAANKLFKESKFRIITRQPPEKYYIATKQISIIDFDDTIYFTYSRYFGPDWSVAATMTYQPYIGCYYISAHNGVYKFYARGKDPVAAAKKKRIYIGCNQYNNHERMILNRFTSNFSHKNLEVELVPSPVLMAAGILSGECLGAICLEKRYQSVPWELSAIHQIRKAGGVVSTIHGGVNFYRYPSLVAARTKKTHDFLHHEIVDVQKYLQNITVNTFGP